MNSLRSIAVVLVAAAALAGCSSEPPRDGEPPVTLTDVKAPDGTGLKQVRLVEHAIERLGITTGTVHQATVAVGGVPAQHKVLPYVAVVYDSDGSSWTYVNTAPQTYLRSRITVATILGDLAVLTTGPADGTAVVTQGAPELLGAEAQIAGEE
jgi:hypothetical protein